MFHVVLLVLSSVTQQKDATQVIPNSRFIEQMCADKQCKQVGK